MIFCRLSVCIARNMEYQRGFEMLVSYGLGIFKSLQIFATSDSEISLCLGTEVEALILCTEFPHRECRPPSRIK